VEPLTADVHRTLEEANKALVSAQGALAQAEKTLAFQEGVPGQVAEKLMATSIPPAARSTRARKPSWRCRT